MVPPKLGKLQDAVRYTEALISSGVDTSNDLALTKMRNELKQLEDAAEEARKQVIEPALDDQVDVGDRVGNVQRVEGEQPAVTDNAAAMEMLEEAGADPAEVVTIHPGQFVDAIDGTGIDPSEVIDHEKYTYYRRDQ